MSSVVRHVTPPAVGRSSGTAASASQVTAPSTVVGRTRELSRLAELLASVHGDGSRLVLVGGDAGSGKTTVVYAFVERLGADPAGPTAEVIRGQCVPLGGDGLPYAPIVGALRDLIGRHGHDQVLDWAGAGRVGLGVLLPDLIPPPAESSTIRLQLFEAIARLCEAASQSAPLVLVIEDLHWADESTRHLLRFLIGALTDAPVLIIATYRTDELDRRHPLRPFLAEVGRFPGVSRLEIGGLSRPEVAELLTRLLGRTPSAVVAELVHRRSEGLPYFVAELATSASRGCVDMPDTLRDALNVRIQRLSDRAQETLQIAAVAGNPVDHALLAAISVREPAELDADLREAVDASILTIDEDGYGFRHALLREVVHEDLLPGLHGRLHASIAALLEARPDLAPGNAAVEIAHHWSAAHALDRAFRWSLTAARSGASAHVETLKQYERALELWDRVAEPEVVADCSHLELLDIAARTARDAGETERSLALTKQALAETADDTPVTDVARRWSERGQRLSSLMRPGAIDALQTAYDLLPDDAEPTVRVQILNQLALVTTLSGVDATIVARAAVAHAERLAAPVAESHARNTLGVCLVSRGREEEGLAELVRAGELADGDLRVKLRYFINYSDALYLTGQYAEAAQQALAGVEVASELGLERSVGAMLAGNAAEPLIALGDWHRATRLIERSLELDPPAHHYVHLRLLRAWLLVWSGRLVEAEEMMADFRGLIDGPEVAPQYACQAICPAVLLALATDDPERAWSGVQSMFAHWDRLHAAHHYPLLWVAARTARSLDRADAADRVGQIRERLASAAEVRNRALWTPVIEAELADDESGWRAALTHLESAVAPSFLLPYVGLRLGQQLVATRSREEARVVLSTATERADALGARLLGDPLRVLARRAGVGATAETATIGGPLAALTAREHEVLRLVAAGRTNGEIGQTLFISTKTASVHVSNILAKLGVASRGEAAALAHQHGLLLEPEPTVPELRPA